MDIIKETLRWVNAERAARGIGPALEDLPRGNRAGCERCPVAVALGGNVEVYGDTVWMGLEEGEVALPEAVEMFVRRFDYGDLPDYDLALA